VNTAVMIDVAQDVGGVVYAAVNRESTAVVIWVWLSGACRCSVPSSVAIWLTLVTEFLLR
jgi:hypothetical protein